MSKVGDLRVWWIPQIPGKSFTTPVSSVEQGAKILDVLAKYDMFQLENRIKPDFSNAGGIERYCEDNGDGKPGWESWFDEETGEDDPFALVKEKSA